MIRSLFLAACALSLVSLHAQDDAKSTPAPAPAKVVQASAVDDIKALAGQVATVEGKVSRVGATASGGLTFINMASGPNAFVAIVFKSNLSKFPDGVDKYKGQTIRVTGKVTIYKEATPQIELKGPDQVEVVAEAAPTATPKDGN